MHLTCESCSAALAASDLDIEELFATCPSCGATFAISDSSAAAREASPGEKLRPRLQPERPWAVEVTRGEPVMGTTGDEGEHPSGLKALPELVVTRRWISIMTLFHFLFCVVWGGALVLWYWLNLDGAGEFSCCSLVFPLLHVAVGIGVSYWTVAHIFNKTTIRVADGVLSLHHGPIPWLGIADIPLARIRQITSGTKVFRGGRDPDVPHRTREAGIRHDLTIDTTDGERILLLSNLRSLDEAAYIHWVLEEHLGIGDEST